jgi:DNA invertase Pin-like site-specific DNA recombinase
LGRRQKPFLFHIHAALAAKEHALISRRTKDALAAIRGRAAFDCLGDYARAQKAEALQRAEQLRPLLEGELAGLSARKIAEELNQRGIKTPKGGAWSPSQVLRVRRRLSLCPVPGRPDAF